MRSSVSPVCLRRLALRGALLAASTANAQVTPAAGYTPPDDTPKIGVGVTIFADYTYNDAPTIKDSDGNTVNKSEFEVRRAYINVTGNINRTCRVPHHARRREPLRHEHVRDLPSGSSVTASHATTTAAWSIRLKYAFGQLNLDDWLEPGLLDPRRPCSRRRSSTSWRAIYRYRFQGTIFVEREGFLTSSDAGFSVRYAFPANYGDVHVGYYNGETLLEGRGERPEGRSRPA